MATEQGYKYYSKEELDEKLLDDFVYSETEKACGVWIDGKTIYRKTIDLGALPDSTTKTVNHNITGIDKIIKIEGIAEHVGSSDTRFIPLPLVYAESAREFNAEFSATKQHITIACARDRSNYVGYATIWYTKEATS